LTGKQKTGGIGKKRFTVRKAKQRYRPKTFKGLPPRGPEVPNPEKDAGPTKN